MQQQVQSQAQISALQQRNALLNQQLATQAASHIHQLQQFLRQPTPTPTAPPASPEPPLPKASPEGTSSTPPSVNPDEMKLRDNFKEEMTDAFRNFQESNQLPPLLHFHLSLRHNYHIHHQWLHNHPMSMPLL
jgi:type II secretory pathway pseudopilin PulG